MKSYLGLAFACFVLAGAVACATAANSERSGAPTVSATPTTAAPTSASPAVPATDLCVEARKTVVTETAKAAQCQTDADCKVHGVVLCDFAELDCYAAHVNKNTSTADLDHAIDAYKKSCPISKCRCATPEKSVCSSGKCSRG